MFGSRKRSGSPAVISPSEQLLLEEYKNAAALTYHIDVLRDRLTAFFVTLAGIASAGLAVVLKDAPGSSLAMHIVSALFILVAVVGAIVVVVSARLRAVQLEHFRILSNIRRYFYGADAAKWNAAELSSTTLPVARRWSGTYMWFTLLAVVSSFALGLGCYLLVGVATDWMNDAMSWVATVAASAIWLAALDKVYLSLATPPAAPAYTESSNPGKA